MPHFFSDCAWQPEVWGLTGSDGASAGLPVPRGGGAAGPAQGRGTAVSRPPARPAVAEWRRVRLVSARIVSLCPVPLGAAPFSAPSLTAPGAASALCSVTAATSTVLAGLAQCLSVVGEQYPSDVVLLDVVPRWP